MIGMTVNYICPDCNHNMRYWGIKGSWIMARCRYCKISGAIRLLAYDTNTPFPSEP